jgi:hypothetical protein
VLGQQPVNQLRWAERRQQAEAELAGIASAAPSHRRRRLYLGAGHCCRQLDRKQLLETRPLRDDGATSIETSAVKLA